MRTTVLAVAAALAVGCGGLPRTPDEPVVRHGAIETEVCLWGICAPIRVVASAGKVCAQIGPLYRCFEAGK